MYRITKKEQVFFDYFMEAAEIACQAAKALDELINNYVNIPEKIRAIKELEHKGDLCIHNIFNQLNKSFITPIDREDIHQISKELDNIIDFIESTAQRFIMFNVKTATEDSKKFSKLIVVCTEELKNVINELRNLKINKTIIDKIIEVNRIENEGDELYRSSMTKLFSNGTDTLDIIKWKTIYDKFENSLDACEDVANIIEGVIMKHA